MDKSELIAEFKVQLEHFEKYQSYIDKARGYADRFNPAVVEKVVSDNTVKIREVAAILDPFVSEMRSVIAGLEDEREAIIRGSGDSRLALEEMELRAAIGEISPDALEEESNVHRAKIASADADSAAVEAELEEFRATLDTWLAHRPVEIGPLGDADDALEEDLLEEEVEEGVDLVDDADVGEEDIFEEEEIHVDISVMGAEADGGASAYDDTGRGFGQHSEAVSIADDISDVFDSGAEGEEPIAATDDEIIVADDGGVMEGEDAGIDFAPDELAELGGEAVAEKGADDGALAEGRAVLIVGEGTAEEHIFPFDGDSISLGRGRDNKIQIKNDSKVSRYHCRVFRRNGQYYVEDNKSANGTLVDGELITEKRLFGGEEVIVGETFFRFRIQ